MRICVCVFLLRSAVIAVDPTTKLQHKPETVTVETKRGGLVGYLSTPTVKAVVREHFNCPTLPGAELENQSTSSGRCFGSHWERRLFPTST